MRHETLIPVPRPKKCEEIRDPEHAPLVRKLQCRSYDACLDIAVARDWPSFTCVSCDAFAQMSPEELARDVGPLHQLLGEAFRSRR